MALLRRCAPSMELSLRMCRRPAPQLPLWIHRSGRGGLLVSHGDGPRQDIWVQGVPLCFRFVASTANSVSSVSARPQYLPILCHRQQHPSSAKRNLLLQQNSARAQGRLFCSYINWLVEGDTTEHGTVLFSMARNKLQAAVRANHREQMLQGLRFLKVFAEDRNYYDVEYNAKDLLSTVVSPLRGKHGGGLDDDVVKESLTVARLLLQKAPEEIRIELCKEVELELKPVLERIRDYGGSAYLEVIKLANEILTQLPSTLK